jgi:hypothetical protein
MDSVADSRTGTDVCFGVGRVHAGGRLVNNPRAIRGPVWFYQTRQMQQNSISSKTLFCVGKIVHSLQYILLQYSLHFFRFFKQRAVS